MPFKIFAFLLIAFLSTCHAEDKALLMGLIIQDNDASIPTFLKKIEEMDYDKKAIRLKIYTLNANPDVTASLETWRKTHEGKYANFNIETTTLSPAAIKNSLLYEDPESEWIFITSSDVFLKPFTLRILTHKNLPILAPLLRPIPTQNTPFRNFFLSANEKGYYKDNPNYFDIADARKTGTFRADCVHKAYLIRTKYAHQLDFEGDSPYDFISFSNNARKNGVPQFICNEKEFGFFIHTSDSPKLLNFPWIDQEITRTEIQQLSQDLNDPELNQYQEAFPIGVYSLYKVGDDTYWVDEKWDWIKSAFIKQGMMWEPHIEELFKKYVKKGDTVIDMGGHIGTHAIALSKCVGSQGKVHTFEPQAKLFTELLVNTSLNNCHNVIAHRIALGSQKGEVFIAHPSTINEGAARVASQGEKVKINTLDSFNISPVSFMKIDVEGHEIEALKGALQTIKKNKPVLVVEVFEGSERESRLNFIRELGYDISHLQGDDFLALPNLL